jgi:hypothetical protein
LVETKGVAKLFDLPRSCAFAEHLFHGIAGNNVNQKKNQSEHEPNGRERKQKAMKYVAGHA